MEDKPAISAKKLYQMVVDNYNSDAARIKREADELKKIINDKIAFAARQGLTILEKRKIYVASIGQAGDRVRAEIKRCLRCITFTFEEDLMGRMKKLLLLLLLVGCSKEADVASQNLSTAADQFQIDRRIVFYDSIQGEYLLSIEGRCSIYVDVPEKQLEVTCKTSETEYKKHFLGLSDNVTYFAEQMQQAKVNAYRYKVIFRPSIMIPDVEAKL